MSWYAHCFYFINGIRKLRRWPNFHPRSQDEMVPQDTFKRVMGRESCFLLLPVIPALVVDIYVSAILDVEQIHSDRPFVLRSAHPYDHLRDSLPVLALFSCRTLPRKHSKRVNCIFKLVLDIGLCLFCIIFLCFQDFPISSNHRSLMIVSADLSYP